jgi:hypothetical protein
MVQILFLDVLDAKIVHHQYKLDWFGFVLSKSRNNLALKVSEFWRRWEEEETT